MGHDIPAACTCKACVFACVLLTPIMRMTCRAICTSFFFPCSSVKQLCIAVKNLQSLSQAGHVRLLTFTSFSLSDHTQQRCPMSTVQFTTCLPRRCQASWLGSITLLGSVTLPALLCINTTLMFCCRGVAYLARMPELVHVRMAGCIRICLYMEAEEDCSRTSLQRWAHYSRQPLRYRLQGKLRRLSCAGGAHHG